MIIANYTGGNYQECLNITLPTWQAEKIIIYSDTDKFGIEKFEPTNDFNECCRRKILTIKDIIKDNQGENIVYLDTDVLMRERVDEVFQYPVDLIVTRMVRRERNHHPEINAGVFFIKANKRTLEMCDQWLELEAQNRNTEKYPEQNALNQIAFQGYDGVGITVGNVSENIYNFERDSVRLFKKEIGNAKLIHLKNKYWQNPEILQFIKTI